MFLKKKFREPGKLLIVFISAIKVSVYFIVKTQSCGATTFCEFKVSRKRHETLSSKKVAFLYLKTYLFANLYIYIYIYVYYIYYIYI